MSVAGRDAGVSDSQPGHRVHACHHVVGGAFHVRVVADPVRLHRVSAQAPGAARGLGVQDARWRVDVLRLPGVFRLRHRAADLAGRHAPGFAGQPGVVPAAGDRLCGEAEADAHRLSARKTGRRHHQGPALRGLGVCGCTAPR
ncbi:hypothetical protein XHV734_0811 [Xanthomonas hortorum pv. vitians]|nr:hypothetical protein XHV734_0811 [Xanthomonas hortorum pv. vitians]